MRISTPFTAAVRAIKISIAWRSMFVDQIFCLAHRNLD
jgi:hypothetical protein